ncbi:MAG: urease accessory protein UreD [Paracoccaceae bacterium]|nr:urease accessory protein UreD [Paracoccaceae bacterium]
MSTCDFETRHDLIDVIHIESILERAKGEVVLETKARDGQSAIRRLRQSGSLKCLFPRCNGDSLEAVLLNCAGGVTGGDHFSLSVRAESGTTLTLTTQAAERIYRALPGERGQIHTLLKVEKGARMNWLPQETILFDGCSLNRSLRIDLSEDARLLMAEPLIFGRFEMGEVLNCASILDCIEIRRNGSPIFLERIGLQSDVQAKLNRLGIADGAHTMASLVYVADDADVKRDLLHQMLPRHAGVSLIQDDVLTMRLLAKDSDELRSNLVPMIKHLNKGVIPKCWII